MPIKKSFDERERILNLVNKVEEEEQEKREDLGNSFSPSPTKKRPNKLLRTLLFLAIIIAVVFVILYGVSKYTKVDILKLGKGTVGRWQSVFLSNGQVYFGHVVKYSKNEIVLRDIYYLQVNRQIQPKQEGQEAQTELTLVKLGNELHGPVDEMRINRFHVLFIEDLKDNSQVVATINDYIKKQK